MLLQSLLLLAQRRASVMRRGAETGASVSHHSESCQQTHHYTLKKVLNHGGLKAQVSCDMPTTKPQVAEVHEDCAAICAGDVPATTKKNCVMKWLICPAPPSRRNDQDA